MKTMKIILEVKLKTDMCIPNVLIHLAEAFLFTEDGSQRPGEVAQCSNPGVRSCLTVKLNYENLNKHGGQESLGLVPGSGVQVELEDKVVEGHGKTMNVTFTFSLVGQEGGEGTLTFRPETQNTHGMFMSGDGTVHYQVETCGDKCTVLYQADIEYGEDYQEVVME